MITPDQITAALRHLGWHSGTADQVLAEIDISKQLLTRTQGT